MNQIYRIYKIKKSDTVFSIADKNNLNIKELIAYHNKRAGSLEQIRNKIPAILKEFILPPDGFELINGKEVWLNKDQEEPEILRDIYTGKLNCGNYSNDLNYAVYKVIESGGKKNTIKYEVSVRYYPESEDGENYISVDVISDIFINDTEPSLIADELAIACVVVLYPLTLKISSDGLLLEIKNHDEILKRWEKHKKTKLKYYQGEIANDYIKIFEETLVEKELLLHFLQKDWFYSVYFNTIYTIYNDKSTAIYFPILPNTKEVEFTIKNKAEKIIKNNRIKIERKGICTDLRNTNELENGHYFSSMISKNKKNVKGNYRSIYFLKPNNHRIQHAFLECDLELSKPKKVSISISEMGKTVNKEVIRHPEYIIEKEEFEENKKSFWKSIFS